MSTDPFDIPDGYCVKKHQALRETIARPGALHLARPLRVMACHEAKPGAEIPCVGWLAHQLGPGNNITLRLRAHQDPTLGDFELDGPQRETFEDTIPQQRRARR